MYGRGVFWNQSNIYYEVFFFSKIVAFSRSLFLQKSSIVDVRLGSKHASVWVPAAVISYFYNKSTELIIHLWIAKRSAKAATVFSPPDKLSIGRNL